MRDSCGNFSFVSKLTQKYATDNWLEGEKDFDF